MALCKDLIQALAMRSLCINLKNGYIEKKVWES